MWVGVLENAPHRRCAPPSEHMNNTDRNAKPQRKAIPRLPAAPRHERCRAAVLEAMTRLPTLADDVAVRAASSAAVAADSYVQAEEARLAKLPIWMGRENTNELNRLKHLASESAVAVWVQEAGGGLAYWPYRRGGQPWRLARDLYLALGAWSQPDIRSALSRLAAEHLLERSGGLNIKDAPAVRLTAAGAAAAAGVQKPPRDRALVLAELRALANDDHDLRARLATYLADGSDDTEGGGA